jgi:hypothetical protein
MHPITFPSSVSTFLDLWIDPYEFDCTLLKLDALPAPLTVILTWTSHEPLSSLWIPRKAPGDWSFVAQHSIVPVERDQNSAQLSSTIQSLALEKGVSEPQMALLSLVTCLYRVLLQDPARFLALDAKPRTKPEETTVVRSEH